MKQVSNFTPLVSRFAKTGFYLCPMKLRTLDLNLVIESIFLISSLSVLHSLAQCGKKNDVSNDLLLAGKVSFSFELKMEMSKFFRC